jgi:type II secretory pathway component PulF
LLEAGLPLSRALTALEEVAPGEFRQALPRIRQEVQEGKGLGAAMMMALPHTPAIVSGIIRSGEAGSGLPSAVRRAGEMVEEAAKVRSTIRAALAYPLLLATSGIGAVALLVTVVLPRFEVMFSDVGQTLPPTTRFVLGAARVAQATAIPALVAAFVALCTFVTWCSSEKGMRNFHRLLLTMPFLGSTRRSAAVARTCAALAALLEAGVPVGIALANAARASGDAELTPRLLDARTAVIRGERLSDALRDQDASTQTVVRLVRAGEESGRLAALLNHAARIERDFAIQRTRAMVRLLEPSLILVFGGMVALVAAAMLQAMYSIRPGV